MCTPCIPGRLGPALCIYTPCIPGCLGPASCMCTLCIPGHLGPASRMCIAWIPGSLGPASRMCTPCIPGCLVPAARSSLCSPCVSRGCNPVQANLGFMLCAIIHQSRWTNSYLQYKHLNRTDSTLGVPCSFWIWLGWGKENTKRLHFPYEFFVLSSLPVTVCCCWELLE